MTEKKSVSDTKYRSILLFFSDNIIEAFKLKYSGLINNNHQTYKEIELFEYDQYSMSFRSSLMLLIRNDQSETQELLQVKFNEIMLYLLKHEPQKINAVLSLSKNNEELKFRRIIENNLFSNLDLEELSFISNMSLSTFKRHFKKYYQVSPQKYFQLKKLEFSKYLIQKGEKPNNIYVKSGYNTLSNFIKAYKAHFGNTPGS